MEAYLPGQRKQIKEKGKKIVSKYDLYDDLIKKGYIPLQIHQLLFLYDYFRKNNKEEDFYLFLNRINPSYDADFLEQVIKCMTHNTTYDLFLEYDVLSKEEMNELRRFLEDCIEYDPDHISTYYGMAEEILKHHWYPEVIYQFRRFIKCRIPLPETGTGYLLSFIMDHGISQWMIVNSIYMVYVSSYSVNRLNQFLYDDEFIRLIHLYSKYESSETGDKLLIQIQEYADNFINQANSACKTKTE